MTRAFTSILLEHAGPVATITLSRPEVLNALDRTMRREMLAALDAVQQDADVRALVITGAGQGFCAGADLRDRGAEHDPARVLVDEYNPLIRAIRMFPRPVVTGVNGVAAGAGMSIALAGDLVVAADEARFVPAFARVALVPDSGLTRALVRSLGRHRAAAHLIAGDPMTATEAHDCGLVYRVVQPEDLRAVAQKVAAQLARGPTYALELTKRLVNEAEDATLEGSMASEAALQRDAAMSEDHREAVGAFLRKSEPEFGGR